MKEKTLLEMKKKVDALSNVMQHVYNELGNLRELSVGTLETIKLMNGYDDAIKTLQEKVKEQQTKEDTKEKVLEL